MKYSHLPLLHHGTAPPNPKHHHKWIKPNLLNKCISQSALYLLNITKHWPPPPSKLPGDGIKLGSINYLGGASAPLISGAFILIAIVVKCLLLLAPIKVSKGQCNIFCFIFKSVFGRRFPPFLPQPSSDWDIQSFSPGLFMVRLPF